MVYFIKISQYGCEEGDFNMEDLEGSPCYQDGRHFQCYFWYGVDVTNTRYLKSQQIILEHEDEERQFNHVFCEDYAIGLNGDTKDLKARWLEEDELEGIVEGLNATIDVVWFVAHPLRGLQ